MDDKIGFNLKDKEYQKRKEELERKTRADIEQELQEGKGFKFSSHLTQWMIDNYPYTQKERDKALKAESDKRAEREAEILKEIDKRTAEQKAVLEQLIFGKHGRTCALQQAEREEKIKVHQDKQEQKREQERQIQVRTIEQSKKNAQRLVQQHKDTRSLEQDNTKQFTMRADFNTNIKKGKIKADGKIKIENFKRRRQEQESNIQEKSSELHVKDNFNLAHSKAEIEAHLDGKNPVNTKAEKEVQFKENMQEILDKKFQSLDNEIEPEI